MENSKDELVKWYPGITLNFFHLVVSRYFYTVWLLSIFARE